MKKILFLTTTFPYNKLTGATIKTSLLLNELIKKNFKLKLLCFEKPDFFKKNVKIEFDFVKKRKAVAFFPSITLARYYHTKMEKKFHESLKKFHPDFVICDHLHTAIYAFKQYVNKVLLIAHNIQHEVFYSFYKTVRFPLNLFFLLESFLLKQYESKIYPFVNHVSFVSEQDLKHATKDFRVNGILFKNFPSISIFNHARFKKKSDNLVLFTGDFKWLPNIQAFNFIVRQLAPAALSNSLNLKFMLAGFGLQSLLKSYNLPPNVVPILENLNFVDIFNNSDIFIAPIFSGGGTKIKILEAWAGYKPVIATKYALKGLRYSESKNVLIAETKFEFLNKIVKLLKDKNLRTNMAIQSRQLVHSYYNPVKIISSFLKTITSIMLS